MNTRRAAAHSFRASTRATSIIACTGLFLSIVLLHGADLASASIGAEDGQWTMPAKDYASTRYSGLEQINAANAKDLKLSWKFDTGVHRGQEAAPIVVGSTMYVV